MRTDMDKVIVERPRIGSSRPNLTVGKYRREGRHRDPEALDALSSRAPLGPRGGGRKYLNENLAPLRRFLMANVGRRWEDVYAELRAQLSPRSAVQMHICQHLGDYVELHVRIEGREVYRLTPRWSRAPQPLRDNGRTLYVHPETRRLCRPTSRAEHYQPPKPDVPNAKRLDDGRLAVALHGAWFAVELTRVTAAEARPWDVVFREEVGAANSERRRALYGRDAWYAVHKRQLSSTECRRAGLA